MTWFEDGSTCSYFGEEHSDRLIAIGWLSSEHDFTTGSVAREDLEKIQRLAASALQFPRFVFRGFHVCELCDDADWRLVDEDGVKIPSSSHLNVFVPSGDKLFVFPENLPHSIAEHGYVPPEDFIKAVRRCPEPGPELSKLIHAIGGPAFDPDQVGRCVVCGGVMRPWAGQTTVRGVTVEAEGVRCDCPLKVSLRCTPKQHAALHSAVMAKLVEQGARTGEQLSFLRGKAGLREPELAELLQVTPQTVDGWELDRLPIPPLVGLVVARLATDGRQTRDQLRAAGRPTSEQLAAAIRATAKRELEDESSLSAKNRASVPSAVRGGLVVLADIGGVCVLEPVGRFRVFAHDTGEECPLSDISDRAARRMLFERYPELAIAVLLSEAER